MTQADLALLVAEALSGPSRLVNVKRYGAIIRRFGMRRLDELWAAAGIASLAPIAAGLNCSGMTAESDHHPLAARLRRSTCRAI